MKYRHYAPRAELTLVEAAEDETAGCEAGRYEAAGYEAAGYEAAGYEAVRGQERVGCGGQMRDGQVERMVGKVKELAHEKLIQGCQVGIICTDESRSCYTEGTVRSIGARKSQESVAHNLYAVLREFDDLKVEYIFSESFSEDHLGQAIMNRLSKAAGYKIVRV